MGYVLQKEGFSKLIETLGKQYRLFAPVLKKGEGRYTDVDVVRYDLVSSSDQIELEKKSDYAFKEFLTPLSETLFFFAEGNVKEADLDMRPVIIFLRSCDMHAVKRLDQIYLENGSEKDWFYARRRGLVSFALIGCSHSFENCFCVDMKSNVTKDGYLFSVDQIDGKIYSDLKDDGLKDLFEANAESVQDVTPQYVKENQVHVTIPDKVDNSIYKHPLWDEYTSRCIGCGRCNFVCPTCTCYTMQDVYYTENGKMGERRRVGASCMVDGYTNVAGGGQYRKTHGERMRFKVLHKIFDFRRRFGYDMCVGCGRCDDVCPEYISYSNIINKVNEAAKAGKEVQ
ncbi:MAG: anaerobic sulfite reductase subunit AsrA [Lachnospiraceae bacterium]|nr:anaerobic sulfite reductase subunit AsrA [Lachnospiraceae bacterium]